MTESMQLIPQIPVLAEYDTMVNEITARIAKLNSITKLTEDNKKEVKFAISEMEKVKTRISRFRIDKTAEFLAYLDPYTNQCKKLEELCKHGVADAKLKVVKLEAKEKAQKTDTVNKLFDFIIEACPYRNLLKFEMFFEQSMSNKSTSLSVIETRLKEWALHRTADLDFIKKNSDEVNEIIAIYLQNGLNLTSAIDSQQARYKSESEIKAMIAVEAKKITEPQALKTFEKKIDITVSIKQLPQSKVEALESFLNGLGVEWVAK